MAIASIILTVLGSIFSAIYVYQVIFIIIGLFAKKKKYKDAKENHTFGIVICGRNEEKVIGNLIESIKNNDYPQDKIKIFVCADNCTDKTAEICRDLGAIVYERFNKEQIGKGYALNYLFQNIYKDMPEYVPDAIMVFDADNVLTTNYIKEMNKALDSGVKICTSFRNSKNFDSSWVSSGASVLFLRECMFIHKPKSFFKLSTHVSGTGFYFSKDILTFKDGWPYTMITEDLEFSAFSTLKGVKIGYCEDAEFFDEQPVKFKQAWRQRLRWSKGGLLGFSIFHASLSASFLKTLDFTYYEYYFSRFFPISIFYLFSFLATCIINITTRILEVIHQNLIVGIIYYLSPILTALLTSYLAMLLDSLITVIVCWKKIKAPARKKILSIFVTPLFTMFISTPCAFVALFKKVKWDPIEHNQSVTQQQLNKN